jgi:CAAX prenyl protease-like protein
VSGNLRTNTTVAHIAPFAVFMLFTALVPAVAIKNSALPWWRSAPEHWIYPLQTIVCGALLIFLWKNYSFKPTRGFVLATVLGVVSIVIWILPAHLFHAWKANEIQSIPLLGFAARSEGFDPTIFEHDRFAYPLVIIMRFIRMIIVVPLVEEILWRGWLMRWLVSNDEKPFTSVQTGTHTWKAFVITTACVVIVHQPEDYLGALIFGSLMYFLCVRTKSLAACVWMHAVANLVLGIYVLKTRQWGFW